MWYISDEEKQLVKQLVKQFESGKMPKKLTADQHISLLERYSRDAFKEIKWDGLAKGVDAPNMLSKRFSKTMEQAKSFIKEKRLESISIDVGYDAVVVCGYPSKTDAELIKAFHKEWKANQKNVETEITDLTKRLNQLKAQQAKTKSKESK
jgi:hypothetical protein